MNKKTSNTKQKQEHANEIQSIEMQSIVHSQINPRKSINMDTVQELADSMETVGLLQPIMVRPLGSGTFEIVTGERRYRAAKLNNWLSIPCIVHNYADEEVLEIQMLENLQRENMSVMDEASAFNTLYISGKFNIQEISKRAGKSPSYISQRIALSSLYEGFHPFVSSAQMTIKGALLVAALPASAQIEYFKQKEDEHRFNSPDYTLVVHKSEIDKYTGKLSYATFDLNEIYDGALPCIGCPFNSTTANLFNDEDTDARCNNISCFSNKTQTAFNENLASAQLNAEVILIERHGQKKNKLNDKNIEVLAEKDYIELSKPDAPNDRDWYDGDNETPEEDEADYQAGLKEYQQELAEYEKQTQSAEYKKAFIVSGRGQGEYTFVKLREKGGKPDAKMEPTGGQSMEADADQPQKEIAFIEDEIKRMVEKEKRSVQIDENKMWEQLRPNFIPAVCSIKSDALSDAERKGLAIVIYNTINQNRRSDFRHTFKWEFGESVSEDVITRMLKFMVIDKLPPALIFQGYTEITAVCLDIANQYFPKELEKIMIAQEAISEKRTTNVTKRIAELSAKKEDWQAKIPVVDDTKIEKKSSKKSSKK